MGTRCLTFVTNDEGFPIICMTKPLSSHQRTVQAYRENTGASSMALVRLHVYRCKLCVQPAYQTAGRKKCANGGWICPACVEKQKGK